MMQSSKTLGYVLIGFSAVLLLILTIVKIDTDKQAAFLCEKFHENKLDMEQCPAHKSNTSWLIVSGFVITFLILGVGLYLAFIFKLTEQPKREFKRMDLSKLDDEEKKIYGIIKGKEGSAYQTDLIKETGFSKVKITRILDKLEAKGILERKRRGMTNLIVLK